MKSINSFIIGKVTKAHSFKGEMLIVCEYKELVDTIEEKEQVMFIYINEKPVPFFIENIRQIGSYSLVVKLEDVDNEVEANKYKGFSVGLDIKYQEEVRSQKNLISNSLIGFKVVDENFGMIGTLKDIIEYPHQLIMEIIHNDRNVLVPYNEEFVKNIDNTTNTISVSCPDGLVDLYLNT